VGNLGNLLGFGSFHLPFWLGVPFTLVAVFGILNALNMMDGIDGVAGGITLLIITLLYWTTNTSKDLEVLGPLLGGAITSYLACNLGLLPRLPKIFLGDAGSKLLGLSIVWFLIDVAKSGSANAGGIEPATALYAVGLPLFDMVSVTIRRVKKGLSPFSPDKTHIHHIFLRAGFSKNQTILIVLGIAMLFNILGLLLNLLQAPELLQFALFFCLYLLYTYNIHKGFKFSIRLRQALSARKATESNLEP
jgi:UDP-GlcNAc:undecaprenyl-phosphate GlcNAc-1-phosphate transferase